MKPLIFSILGIAICFFSCTPELVTEALSPYYELTVNGNKIFVEACGIGDHVAKYLKDTAVWADFGCDGKRAGFYLKGQITDGQYQLDHRNQAWYEEDGSNYSTDSLHPGTLTIRTVVNPGSGFSILCVEGEISFQGIDHDTGKTINVTNGRYLLKKYQY